MKIIDNGSQASYKHSNSSVPSQFMKQRRSSSRRVNSIYNRYGFGGDNGIQEALRTRKKMQYEAVPNTRESGASLG